MHGFVMSVQGGSLSEFSGLRSSTSLPMRRNATSDDFMSAVSFRTHAVRTVPSPMMIRVYSIEMR